jgi:hypothetical protein
MASASTSYIEQTLRRMAQSGDLDVVVTLVRGAAKLVEDELLKKLQTFPVGEPSDLSAFAYRQGWLRGLKQVEAILDPDRVRRALEATDEFDRERTRFEDERF